MIQSPSSQYPQVIAPQVTAQQSAPVQLTPEAQQIPATPMTYYNYPSSNLYQYPQAQSYQPAQPSQANAVNIQIYNPQAYAGGANAQAALTAPTMPAQFIPVAPQQAPAAPVIQTQAAPVIEQAPTAPVPPAPAITESAPAEAPKVVEPQAQAPATDLASFNAKLRSANLEDQSAAIEGIAEMTQTNPQAATQLLDTQIMEGLLGVIAKDTTALQGPTPKQLELRQQIIAGKTLTDAEKAEANTITPMEMGERNKQYALYTIAFLQDLLASEVEKRNGVKLDIKDLPAIEQVVQTAKSDPNPLLRVSALAALAHIAKPEYKAVLSQVFELAKADADPNVQEAAKKASEQLAKVGDAPAAAPTAPAEAPKAEAPAAPVEAPKAEEKKA